MKKIVCALVAALHVVSCFAYAVTNEAAVQTTDSMRYITSEIVRDVMAHTVMLQPHAEFGFVYGERRSLPQESEGVYEKDQHIYVPTAFLADALPAYSLGAERDTDLNVYAEKHNLTIQRKGETIYISQSYVLPEKLPDSIDRFFGIYASPQGGLGGGGYDSPIGGISEAKTLASRVKASIGLPDGGLVVYLREGTYPVKNTVHFTQEDSGKEGAPIVYKAYGDEQVAFNGGISISGRDFKQVEDPSALKRLPQPHNVVCADISDQLTGFSTAFKEDDPAKWNINYRGENLTVCRWPDKTFALTGEILESDKENWRNKGFRFVVDDTRIKNWIGENDPRIFGYFIVRWAGEFRKITDVRLSDLSVKSDRGAEYGILSGKEYYVYNMLSELDNCGEFYFDAKKNLLYLYPVEGDVNDPEFLSHNVQFALLTQTMFSLEGCGYVTFDGVTFENTVGRVMEMDRSCKNVTVKGCTFKNIADGIIQRGYNNLITGCDFYSVTSNPVEMDGGDRYTLTPSQSVIQNCSFKNFNTVARTNNGAIRLMGCGDVISHNEIVGGPHTAIGLDGNENVVEYNEFYDNLVDQAEDAGVVYGGRSLASQNNVIRYNYFHDVSPSLGVIYFDDTMSNMHSLTNVFVNTGSAMIMHGGVNNSMNDCLVINSTSCGGSVIPDGNAVKFWNSSTATSLPANTALWRLMQYPYKSKPWQKYNDVFKHIDAHLDLTVVPPYDCEFIGNTFVNLGNTQNATQGVQAIGDDVAPYVTIRDNTVVSAEDAPDFVIPERYQKIMDQAGIYMDEDRPALNSLGSFDLLEPKDRAKSVEGNEVTFQWSVAENANRYLFTLATDPEFENIISNKYVKNNYVTLNKLNYHKTRYYWKVKAVANDTNSMVSQPVMDANQPYYSFTTKEREMLNKEKLNDLLTLCRNQAETVVEGDKPGEYKRGVKAEMDELLAMYQGRADSSMVTQRDLNYMTAELKTQFDILMEKRNSQYVDMNELLAGPGWSITPNQFTLTPGYLKHTTKANSTFGTAERVPSYQIMKFNAKIDRITTGFVGFGVRAQASPTAVAWAGNDQYLIIIKEKTFEFQKFGGSESVLEEYPNTYVKSGETHEYEVAALNNDDGTVTVTFKIDGETVIEYLDKKEPIVQGGFFEVYATETDCTIEITPAE